MKTTKVHSILVFVAQYTFWEHILKGERLKYLIIKVFTKYPDPGSNRDGSESIGV